MAKIVELLCAYCGSSVTKPLKEYTRQVKGGRSPDQFFCDLSCTAKYKNGLIEPGGKQDLIRRSNLVKVDHYGNTYNQKGSFTWYLNKCRSRAKANDRKRLGMDIDEDYLAEVWNKQQGRCAWSGLPITLRNYLLPESHFGVASLDRIDSSIGYVKGNVQFVSLPLNLAKGNKNDDDMLVFLTKLTDCFKEMHTVSAVC